MGYTILGKSYAFDDLLLVPKMSEVRSRSQVDLSVKLCKDFVFSGPVVPSNMATICELDMARLMYQEKNMAIFHRFTSFERQLEWLEEVKSWHDGLRCVGFSIGVKEEDYRNVDILVERGAQIILIDVAHGWSVQCLEMTKYVSSKYPEVLLISGNSAEGQGAAAIWQAGADVVKNGVGQGCFAAGTRVLMSDGFYKNIEEIVPGDRVINKNGKPVKVKDAFCTGKKKVIKIKNNLWYDSTGVTPDHQFWAGDLNSIKDICSVSRAKCLDKREKSPGKPSKYKWKAIGDFKQDLMLMPNKINFELPETFSIDINKKIGGNYKSGYTYAKETTLTPSYEMGYIFGTFLGDGCALSTEYEGSHIGSVSWYLGLEELNIVNKIQECLKKIFPNYSSSFEKNESIYDLKFYNKPFADFLYKFGKKKDKFLPKELLVNNRDYLQGLFDGLIDTDGSIEKYGRKSFTNTSNKLIELFNVVTYLCYGYFPSNSYRKPTVGGLKGCSIDNCNPSYASRIGTTIESSLTKDYQIAELISKSDVEEECLVYDITVDCDTHSFIANNAIVHNSICLTRVNASNGVASLTSLMSCADYKAIMQPLLKRPLFFINDGGARTPGDLGKSLCFADMCMAGNMFAATTETPGEIITINEISYKKYNGSSTHKNGVHKEGVEALKVLKGSAKEVLRQIRDGLSSCCSYQGVFNLTDLKKDPQFMEVSLAGIKESGAHDVDMVIK